MCFHSSFEADVRGGLGNAPARRNVMERDARSTARRPGAEYVDGQRSRCHWLTPSSAHRALGARDETGDSSGFERKKAAIIWLRAVSAPPRNARVAFSRNAQPGEPREGATRTAKAERAKAGHAEPHRSFRATKKNTLTCVSGTLPPAALLARRVARPERTRFFVFFFPSW